MNSKLDLVVVIPESEEGRRSFDRLVKAAEELFSQQGYRSTTIKDIAQSAGLSVGAFYIYFRSKYQIYVYIMQSFALRLQNYLDSRAGKITGDLIERQVEYIMEFIGFAYKNPACYNLIFESLYIDRDLFLQYYYQYAQRYVPALTKSRALPEGMDPMLWSFINMGIGNFIGLKVLAENDAGPEQMEKYAKLCASFCGQDCQKPRRSKSRPCPAIAGRKSVALAQLANTIK